MNTQHTPGPWSIEGWTILNETTLQYIADVRHDANNDAEAQANARLIAAAPTLLNAAILTVQEIEAVASMRLRNAEVGADILTGMTATERAYYLPLRQAIAQAIALATPDAGKGAGK